VQMPWSGAGADALVWSWCRCLGLELVQMPWCRCLGVELVQMPWSGAGCITQYTKPHNTFLPGASKTCRTVPYSSAALHAD